MALFVQSRRQKVSSIVSTTRVQLVLTCGIPQGYVLAGTCSVVCSVISLTQSYNLPPLVMSMTIALTAADRSGP